MNDRVCTQLEWLKHRSFCGGGRRPGKSFRMLATQFSRLTKRTNLANTEMTGKPRQGMGMVTLPSGCFGFDCLYCPFAALVRYLRLRIAGLRPFGT